MYSWATKKALVTIRNGQIASVIVREIGRKKEGKKERGREGEIDTER